MTDLGLYNFIKNALAKGETKEQIMATLAGASWTPEAIAEAFTSVESGVAPTPSTPTLSTPSIDTNLNSAERSWKIYRQTFWSYFIATLLLNIIGRVLPYSLIPLLTLIGTLICLVQIARLTARASKTITGKTAWITSILSFLCPPIGYYSLYSVTKKAGGHASINILEHFLLLAVEAVFILIILAIVGIFSTVFLAQTHNARVANRPATSTISTDTFVEGSMRGLSVIATRTGVTNHSYASVCENGIASTANQIAELEVKEILEKKNVTSQQAAGITCFATEKDYAISIPLSDGSSYCVDRHLAAGSGKADPVTASCTH